MNKRTYYKDLFLITAIWNWILGLGFILLTSLQPELISSMFGASIPESLVWVHSFFFLVFVIGFAFFFLSRDITKNHAIAQFGVIDKYLILVPILYYFFQGDLNFLGVLPVLVDGVFATLFLEFLLNIKKLK